MRSHRFRFVVLALAVLACASSVFAQESRKKPAPKRGFEALQLAMEQDGTVLMMWAHPTSEGHDLFVAHRLQGDQFSEPTQVNDVAGSVHIISFDEARPALTTGPRGKVAVAWSTTDGDVRVAEGKDHGTHFEPSLQLNSQRGKAPAGFVALAYDDRGRVNATWIDPRTAPAGHEEPAHLYHAVVERGRVTETNLTGDTTTSICGCCRPAIVAQPRGAVDFYYRNAGEDGYRDIHRLTLEANGTLQEPQRLGPAMWKIAGCPSMGPIHAEQLTVWRDASQGEARLLAVRGESSDLRTVGTRGWKPSLSPRFVLTDVSGVPPVLAPGMPSGKVFALRSGRWKTLMDEVPEWCTTMAWVEGQVLMAGDVHGELRLEALDVDWN